LTTILTLLLTLSSAAVFGSAPMLVLLTYTPWRAYMDGLLKFPDILISDTIACSQWHRSVYTTGISMAALSSCVIYSELIRAMKSRIEELPKSTKVDPVLVMALDQFLFTVLAGVVPNLLILISFMFIEDADEYGNIQIPKGEELIQWLLHVVAATLAFMGLGICAFLYAYHIGPKALSLGIESALDVKTRMICAIGIAVTVIFGAPIRAMHIYHSRDTWAFPLLMVEVISLSFGVCANVFGSVGMMMELDATHPKVSFRNLTLKTWWITLVKPMVTLTPFYGHEVLKDSKKKK
jgi:hypothetical protein